MSAEEQSAKRSVRETPSRGGPHVSFGSRSDGDAMVEAEQLRRHLEGLLAELDRREQNLNAQLSLLDRERRAETLRLQRSNAELDARERVVADRERRLDADRAQVDERQARVAAQAASLIRDREQWLEQRQQVESDWEHQPQSIRSEIEQDRAQLSADRFAFETETRERSELLASREAAVTQREVDLEKRYRFQQEHLSRLRRDLTEQIGGLVRDRQRVELWAEQVEATARLRLHQLRRFRALLDRRETDCERGWEELNERRRRDQATIVELRQQLADDRRVLIDERIALEQQFRRRSEQLDRRESELLSGHETVAPSTTEAASGNAAALPNRQTIDPAYDELERCKTQWRIEREDAARVLALREERLREREAALVQHARQLAEREAEWARDQQQRRQERQEAERLIRELLDELADRLA